MSETLQASHFTPLVGKIVQFKGTHFAFPLTEIIVDEQKREWKHRRPFTLIFQAPKERDYLPEGQYVCEFEDGPTYEFYVSPIFTPDPDRQDYQAIFN